MKAAVIGAGAAGCFCAIELKRCRPDASVTIFEAGPRPMAKLALTGGGRCNFTNSFGNVRSLKEVYPRGERIMSRALRNFSHEDCREWFASEGIPSYVQPDGRVFPKSNDALQVVSVMKNLLQRLGVELRCNHKVREITEGWKVDGEDFDTVIVTSGGGEASFLKGLDIPFEPIVPSLFTFRIPDNELNSLSGISVPEITACIPSSGFRAEGDLLLTDWGVSGPAILKLSSIAARHLALVQYRSPLSINWMGYSEEETRRWCNETAAAFPKKQLSGERPKKLPERLWRLLLRRAGLREDLRWAELGAKSINRLVSTLTAFPLAIEGRARFKEEFVSCGGVSLKAVNPSTLECRNHPGLFFAGEVLDIDAVTGGFNLQAAWSTAMLCISAISAISLTGRSA